MGNGINNVNQNHTMSTESGTTQNNVKAQDLGEPVALEQDKRIVICMLDHIEEWCC
ncbi:hypothetical protein DFA_02359 [Cavenderia fasciculata]|uniref:Uncharacterized protein n=1 Tax=Cavenderia fasciculata TaxID=261658 RepID=F4PZ84_CACFS|nr:uncharacterized protein DFA_02359 [Cavenderia fasciculata]EGG19113.1 hypothetical protein DFA_02359 [Cavenderia fasciculata]|eukprot:XP_004366746.1 hypothetical protein DFA_02359 [Cavenderia fasciculata]